MKYFWIFAMWIICFLVSEPAGAITQFLPEAEMVPGVDSQGSHGKIYGGRSGSLWQEIVNRRQELVLKNNQEWKTYMQNFVYNDLSKRIGLYKEQKLNLILELIVNRYKLFSKADLRNLLFAVWPSNAYDQLIQTIRNLGYEGIADYLTTTELEGLDYSVREALAYSS